MWKFFQENQLLTLITISNLVGFIFYWGFGGLLAILYYKGRPPEILKSQSDKTVGSKMVMRDLLLGSINLFILSTITALFGYFIVLKGYSGIYFNLLDHGIAFSIFTFIVYLLWIDVSLYFAHRIFHIPFLFKKIHYVHHQNTTPIAVTSLAMHPLEALTFHAVTFLPMLFIPMHYIAAIIALVYTNVVSLIDHSGIKFNSWFFQSPSQFHDDHHKYFHVNYGQTFWFWDWAFGTWRRKGKAYGVQNFENKDDFKEFIPKNPQYIEYSEESFFVKHRFAAIVFFCLPASFVYTFFVNQWRKLKRCLNRENQHTKSVEIVKADCMKLQENSSAKLCTNRKNWQSLSTRLFDKKAYSQVRIGHLTNIIHVNREALIVRTEPMVTVGQAVDYLASLGYALAVSLEIREATLGGLSMGVGMTTHSHKVGLFQESVQAYEIILPTGEFLRVTETEHSDLFRALPWSHGTLGLLVCIELKIIPIKPYVRLQYTSVFSKAEYCQKIRELAVKADSPDFLEATIFSKERAVIIEGWFDDGKGKILTPKHINRFYQPWFFKHVETFLNNSSAAKGAACELVLFKDYIFRHNRSIFWTLQDMIPMGNHPLARFCIGWMYPPNISFIKLTMPLQIRELTLTKQVFQDIVLPLTALDKAIDLSDELFSIYPLLVYPCRIYDHGKNSGQLRPPREIDRIPGTNFGMYCDLGIYGIPQPVKDNKAYDSIKSMRTMEDFIRQEGGYPFLYADTFMTREEFFQIFDMALYEGVRKQYNLNQAFPDLYEKTRPEIDVLALREREDERRHNEARDQ